MGHGRQRKSKMWFQLLSSLPWKVSLQNVSFSDWWLFVNRSPQLAKSSRFMWGNIMAISPPRFHHIYFEFTYSGSHLKYFLRTLVCLLQNVIPATKHLQQSILSDTQLQCSVFTPSVHCLPNLDKCPTIFLSARAALPASWQVSCGSVRFTPGDI